MMTKIRKGIYLSASRNTVHVFPAEVDGGLLEFAGWSDTVLALLVLGVVVVSYAGRLATPLSVVIHETVYTLETERD